ncbi:MAG: 2-oxoglutarate dehydrogenase E1 subunit family protein, partial [Gemmataceae bacterium]
MSRATVASAMNREIIESTYQQWRLDPSSVDPSWSFFFEGFEAGLAALVVPGQEGQAQASASAQALGSENRDARDHLGISRLI